MTPQEQKELAERIIEELERKIQKWILVSGNGPLASAILSDVQDAIREAMK